MSDYQDLTIGKAAALAAPAAAGAGASVTLLGLNAEQWAIAAAAATVVYVGLQIYVFLPRVAVATRSYCQKAKAYWRKLRGLVSDESDEAGA